VNDMAIEEIVTGYSKGTKQKAMNEVKEQGNMNIKLPQKVNDFLTYARSLPEVDRVDVVLPRDVALPRNLSMKSSGLPKNRYIQIKLNPIQSKGVGVHDGITIQLEPMTVCVEMYINGDMFRIVRGPYILPRSDIYGYLVIPHPNISDMGAICFGNIHDIVSAVVVKRELSLLLDIMLDYLKAYSNHGYVKCDSIYRRFDVVGANREEVLERFNKIRESADVELEVELNPPF